MPLPLREASRVVLLDPAGRVLLMRANGWWFTVGGGVEPGETAEQAAVREVREETGLVVTEADLGPVVHEQTGTVPWNGGLVVQHDEFRVARVATTEVSSDGLADYERASLQDLRWWSAAELRRTAEPVAPAVLPDLLEALAG